MKDVMKIAGIVVKGNEQEIRPDRVLRISSEVFRVVAGEIGLASDTEQEYLLFSSGGEYIDTILPVGTRGSEKDKAGFFYNAHDSVGSQNNAHSVIILAHESGKKIVGDFHCHPPDTGKVMADNGLPEDFGIGPSLDDLRLPFLVEEDFGIRPIRLIGGVMNGEPMLRAYEILRQPTDTERDTICFVGGVGKEDDDFSVEFKYANYSKLLEAGIIRAVEIQVFDRF